MRSRLALASIALGILAGVPTHVQAGGCPPGTVQVGEQREETETAIIIHPVCKRAEAKPATLTPAAHFCKMKERVAADQKAISLLGFAANAEQLDEWANIATEQKAKLDAIKHKAIVDELTTLLVDAPVEIARGKVGYLKSLNTVNIHKRSRQVERAFAKYNKLTGKVGVKLKPDMIVEAMDKVAHVRGKPELAPYADTLLRSIKASKDSILAANSVHEDEMNPVLAILLLAGKVVEKEPWIELGENAVAVEQLMEAAAYGYFLNNSVDRVSALTGADMQRLTMLTARMKTDIVDLKKARAGWSAATGKGGEPDCTR